MAIAIWTWKDAQKRRPGFLAKGAEESISLFVEKFQPEAVVLGPGLEEAHVLGVPVLNNPPEKTSQVSDKLWLASWLEKSGFPFIKTYASAEDLGFPILVKPRKGAGGVGCRIVDGPSDLLWEEGLIAQEIISWKSRKRLGHRQRP